MNTLAHFLFNYIFIDMFTGNAFNFIVPIAIGSTVIDMDHLPYLVKNWKKVLKEGLGAECRTFLHELPGIVFLFAVCIAGAFVTGETALFSILFVSFFLHTALDFTIGDSRPLYPFSNFKVESPLGLHGKKKRLLFEIIATSIMIVVFFFLVSQKLKIVG